MSELEMKQEPQEPRQRKKKLINDVKTLLEFYFSPANISKDKFIQNLLNQDEYIAIEIFLKFNKIKKLTTDTNIIKKAVKKSEILELSQDECKMKRKVPVVFKEDELECTIYVENIPFNSTHEWLQKVFSLYGTIDYISLPRFSNTGRPKGFSFIEFSTPQEAQKAIEAFGGLASLDGTLNPADLLSIKSFQQDDKEADANPEESKIDSKDDNNKRTADDAFGVQDKCNEEHSVKKSKLDDNESESKKSKKKRKRNKKEKQYEMDSVYLRVMAKKDWKSLRNKYLNLQKENMKQLKRLREQSYNTCPQENKMAESSNPKFIPNAIVKFTLSEPLQNLKEFRNGLTSGRKSICYIDANSTDKDVYIRFRNAEAAQNFINEALWKSVELLKGEEEEKYWSKIRESWLSRRSEKRSANTNDSYLRGRDKLITKAFKQTDKIPVNSHVVFDD